MITYKVYTSIVIKKTKKVIENSYIFQNILELFPNVLFRIFFCSYRFIQTTGEIHNISVNSYRIHT